MARLNQFYNFVLILMSFRNFFKKNETFKVFLYGVVLKNKLEK